MPNPGGAQELEGLSNYQDEVQDVRVLSTIGGVLFANPAPLCG
jgi:hypothetical protein